jgi:hypothetical protein
MIIENLHLTHGAVAREDFYGSVFPSNDTLIGIGVSPVSQMEDIGSSHGKHIILYRLYKILFHLILKIQNKLKVISPCRPHGGQQTVASFQVQILV